ncbi:MAG: PAS domain-containing protein [Bacteroidales bacterium]|nr:PAS domain-containing protein [Bacteroidales bacterium]
MKKTLLILSFVVSSLAGVSQIPGPNDSIRDIQIMSEEEFMKEFSSNNTDLLIREQNLRTIFLCGMILAMFGCLAVYYINKVRVRKYSELVNLQSQKLNEMKHQMDSFGLMLNLAQFPSCLVRSDGQIIWCNDSFTKFYGDQRKSFTVLEGTPGDMDINALRQNKFGTTFFVKMKNLNGKTFGFKRTVIPIQNGDNGYAVIENITE